MRLENVARGVLIGMVASLLALTVHGQAAAQPNGPARNVSAKGETMTSTSSPKDVERVLNRYFEIAASHDVSRLGEVLADNYRVHRPEGTMDGLENFRQLMKALWSGGPDVQYFRDVAVVDGDKIAYSYHVQGTHTGVLMGMPPTGKAFTAHGMQIERVENRKIVESWNVVDRLGLMQQLGVSTAPTR